MPTFRHFLPPLNRSKSYSTLCGSRGAGQIPRSGVWSVTDGLSPKFTGQDYDGETLLAYYEARHLASGLGRFMSVDPGNAGADLRNPQSWNMYGYAYNNPLAFT